MTTPTNLHAASRICALLGVSFAKVQRAIVGLTPAVTINGAEFYDDAQVELIRQRLAEKAGRKLTRTTKTATATKG